MTRQEREIIKHLSNGLTQKETAREVFISYRKLENMLKRLRTNYKCKTTTELCVKINVVFRTSTKAA